MATKLVIEELSKRQYSSVFRGQDDLDCFSAAIWRDVPPGPVLVMRHDNNPHGLSAFYVDSARSLVSAQTELIDFFGLSASEVAWVLKDEGA